MTKYQRRSLDEKRDMFQKRGQGQTLQQIADDYGISRQAVQVCLEGYQHVREGYRGHKFNIEQIPYQGIYDYFVLHEDESITSFCKKVFRTQSAGARVVKMRNFLCGNNEVRYNVDEIKQICRVVQLPFAQAFQKREVLK